MIGWLACERRVCDDCALPFWACECPLRLESDEDHAEALRRIEQAMPDDPAAESPEGAALLRLVTAVEAYERVRWPLDRLGE